MHCRVVRIIQVAFVASFLSALSATVLAQGTTGSILGTAMDQSQAVLPGVAITATDHDTGQKVHGGKLADQLIVVARAFSIDLE